MIPLEEKTMPSLDIISDLTLKDKSIETTTSEIPIVSSDSPIPIPKPHKTIDETLTKDDLHTTTYHELEEYVNSGERNLALLKLLETDIIEKLTLLLAKKLNGLSDIPLIHLLNLTDEEMKQLEKYSECIAEGKINKTETIQLLETDKVEEIIIQITSLEKLMKLIPNIKEVVPYPVFKTLIEEDKVLTLFFEYCKEMQPTFHEGDGTEIIEVMEVLKKGYIIKRSLIKPTHFVEIADIAQFLNLTYVQFEKYATEDNLEWANLKFLSEENRSILWEVLNAHYCGLTNISLQELLPFYKDNKEMLEDYSNAVMYGKIGGVNTIQIKEFNNITEIKVHMQYLIKLMEEIPNIKTVMPLKCFLDFVEKPVKIIGLIAYCELFKPTFSMSKGREMQAFLGFYKGHDEMFSYLKTTLPTIVSYHKFSYESIQKLKSDFSDKENKMPLTIILYPAKDKGGAFIGEDIRSVILNRNIKVVVIESNLISINYVQSIIKTHGINQKLNQLMIVGHGSSTTIAIGEKKRSSTSDEVLRSTRPIEDLADMKIEKLEVGSEQWHTFFKMIRSMMEKQKGITPKILLNACLVASHELNFSDPSLTTAKDQEAIRVAIAKQFKDHPNIVEFIKNSIYSFFSTNIPVIGSQGSLDSKIKVIQPDGNLYLTTDTNEGYLTGTYLEYIKKGSDPAGVMLALIASWSQAKDVKAFLTDVLESRKEITIFDSLINIFFDLIKTQFTGDILMAAHCSNSASILQAILSGEKRPLNYIIQDPIIKTKYNFIFSPILMILEGQEIGFFKRITLLQAYYFLEPSKARWLLQGLGDEKLDKTIYPYLFAKELKKTLKALLEDPELDRKGQIFLAIYFANEHADEESILFISNLYKSESVELTMVSKRLSINVLSIIEKKDPSIDELKKVKISDELYVVLIKPSTFSTISEEELTTPELELPIRSEVPMKPIPSIIKIGEVHHSDDSFVCYMVRFPDNQIGYIAESVMKKYM